MERDFNNQDDEDIDADDISNICERIANALHQDVFDCLTGGDKTETYPDGIITVEKILADIRSNLGNYKSIELASYLRYTYCHGSKLCNWDSLLEESKRLSDERKCNTEDLFVGLTPFRITGSILKEPKNLINLNTV